MYLGLIGAIIFPMIPLHLDILLFPNKVTAQTASAVPDIQQKWCGLRQDPRTGADKDASGINKFRSSSGGILSDTNLGAPPPMEDTPRCHQIGTDEIDPQAEFSNDTFL